MEPGNGAAILLNFSDDFINFYFFILFSRCVDSIFLQVWLSPPRSGSGRPCLGCCLSIAGDPHSSDPQATDHNR